MNTALLMYHYYTNVSLVFQELDTLPIVNKKGAEKGQKMNGIKKTNDLQMTYNVVCIAYI